MDAVEQAIGAAKETKETLVRIRGRGQDVRPMLDLIGVGSRFIAEMFDLDREQMLKAVPAAIAACRPFLALYITESYTYIGSPLELMNVFQDYELGQLEERFRARDPHVKEAVLLVARSSEGETTCHALPYEYRGPKVHWLEPMTYTHDLAGDVIDAMARGFDLIAANADPGVQLLAAKDLGVTVRTVSEVLASNPGRNAACVCGSGRKYKHCHGR